MSTQNRSVEELSVTFEDIQGPLSQPVLEDRFEEITQEELRYRELFRNYDATSLNSDTVQMPIPEDTVGNPKIVQEGAEFPRDQEEYRREQLTFDKFGFEIAISMEAQADSQVDLVQDQVDRQARQTREEMNEQAFRTARDAINQNSSRVVSDGPDGIMGFEDILRGREELTTKSFNPDTLIVDVNGSHDLLNDGNFLEAGSEGQVELRRTAEIGQIAGQTVLEDDSGLNITGNDNPGGMLVDTDYFGYEGTRLETTSESYTEDRTQNDVYRVYNRMGWLVTDPEAGVIIEG
jgi:hypothetical protein